MNRLLNVLIKMPFELFVGGMDFFLKNMRQFQAAYNDTADFWTAVDRFPDAAQAPAPPPPAGGGGGSAPRALRDLHESATLSRHDDSCTVPRPQEDKRMYSYGDDCNDLSGDDLKRVSYSIWFKKPDFEALLLDQAYDLIDYPTDGESFAAIKVAEYFSNLRIAPGPIPPKWKGNPPRGDYGYDNPAAPTKFSRIPADDQKYIKFEFKVTRREEKPPKEYDKDQTRAVAEQAAQQKEIAKLLKDFLS